MTIASEQKSGHTTLEHVAALLELTKNEGRCEKPEQMKELCMPGSATYQHDGTRYIEKKYQAIYQQRLKEEVKHTTKRFRVTWLEKCQVRLKKWGDKCPSEAMIEKETKEGQVQVIETKLGTTRIATVLAKKPAFRYKCYDVTGRVTCKVE